MERDSFLQRLAYLRFSRSLIRAFFLGTNWGMGLIIKNHEKRFINYQRMIPITRWVVRFKNKNLLVLFL